jgi:hypothetical protein
MQIQYLEIVTPEVATTCTTIAEIHAVTFSEPVAELGNARTADLPNGDRIGVRAPMRETESPVVRPYFLVDDIAASVNAAAESNTACGSARRAVSAVSSVKQAHNQLTLVSPLGPPSGRGTRLRYAARTFSPTF